MGRGSNGNRNTRPENSNSEVRLTPEESQKLNAAQKPIEVGKALGYAVTNIGGRHGIYADKYYESDSVKFYVETTRGKIDLLRVVGGADKVKLPNGFTLYPQYNNAISKDGKSGALSLDEFKELLKLNKKK